MPDHKISTEEQGTHMKFNGKNVNRIIKEYRKHVKACRKCISRGTLDNKCPRLIECIIGEDTTRKAIAMSTEETMSHLEEMLS